MENSRFEFRVWDNIHEIMMKLSEVNTYSTIDIISNVFKESLNVMQYTGLKDKNGVKVFEGDVVRFIDSEGRDSIIEVRFENGGFYPFAPDYLNCSCVEVIGNKFENPELLGENK